MKRIRFVFSAFLIVSMFLSLLTAPLSSSNVVNAQSGDRAPQGWDLEITIPSDSTDQMPEQVAALQSDGLQVSQEGNLLKISGQGGADELRRVVYEGISKNFSLISNRTDLSVSLPVVKGQFLTLKLETNITTGYRWELTNSDGAILIQQGNAQSTPRGGKHMVGAPQVVTLVYKASSTGIGQLNLSYKRPSGKAEDVKTNINLRLAENPGEVDLSDPNPAVSPLVSEETGPTNKPVSTAPLNGLPTSWDWRTEGIVPDIRNQNPCGSCWAFSATGAFESAIAKNGDPLTDLSEQFLFDCDLEGRTCDSGGNAPDALKYYTNTLGLNQTEIGGVLESEKPYLGTDGTCTVAYNHPYRAYSTGRVAGIAWTIPTVDQIKNAIYTYGPVTADVCVGDNFAAYTSGVFDTDESDDCNGSVNHAIVLVGWDDATETWILRNSWGNDWWGENGYMHIKWGTSQVGLDSAFISYDEVAVDEYEPDDNDSQANTINSGSPQTHSIVPANDEDWVYFQLTTTAAITLETSGATSSDTLIELFDNNLNPIETDDDDGDGNYSKIDRECGVDALPAGTYYAKVYEYQKNDVIPSYNLAFHKQDCAAPPITPGNFRVTGSSQTTISLAWDDVSNETGYRIFEWNGSSFTLAHTIGINSTSFTDTNLSCGSDYFYELAAYNAIGESAHAGWIMGTTSACSPPSANFTASPLTGSSPLTVTMHIVDLANITSCSWDYGDGQTGTSCASNHNHVYANSGTYTVTLSVSGPGGSDSMTRTDYITVVDLYEPDDASGQAKLITAGSPQIHSIVPAGDQDWVKFQLTGTSAISLETNGSTDSDTLIILYNSNLELIESDDDTGTGNYSYIDRLCGVDALTTGTYYVKVYDFYNNQEIPSYNLVFNKQSCAPPTPPAPSVPENASSKPSDYDLNFQWNPSSGATEYLVEWWGGPYSTMQPCGWSSSTSCHVGVITPGYTYSWHVKARSNAGESGWSSTWTFQIRNPVLPPSANFTASPLTGSSPLTVTMHIVDLANITSCSWNYGDGQTSTSCASNHNHVYANSGTYTITLSVSGPGGSDSMTRTDYITVVDLYEPDDTSTQANMIFDFEPQTHSIVPADDQDWVKFQLTTLSSITLETSGTTDSNTILYLYNSSLTEIEFNDNDGYGSYSYIDRVCGVDALPAGTYYVKVDEYNNDQEIPSYDLAFNQQPCVSPPATPVPQSPTGNITTTKPAYVWSRVSGATSYKLAVYDNAAAKYVIIQTVSSSYCSTTTNKCSYTPATVLTLNKDYRWKVLASNAYGSSAYSAFLSFKPILPAPVTYTPNGNITTIKPAYVWSRVSGATSYKLAVYDNIAAKYVIIQTVSSSYCSTTTNKCSYTPATVLTLNKNYRWKVLASNAYGSSAYSAFRNFKPVPPAVPVTYTPSGNITTTKPTYVWSRVSGATTYKLAVYDVSLAKYIIIANVSSSYCSTTTNKCSYKPSTVLTMNKNYKWKVLAFNTYGTSAYSALRSFNISLLPTGFNSQFTSDANGWSAVYGTWAVISGNYKTSGVSNSYVTAVYNATFTKLDYQVNMKRIGSCTGCANIVAIRGTTTPLDPLEKAWNKGYYFHYSNNGSFSIWIFNEGGYSALQPWTETSYINSENWNTLRVIASGTTIKFYINGHLVWSGTDSSLSSGKVGLGMYRYSETGNEMFVNWATLTTAVSASASDLEEPLAETGKEHPEWTDPFNAPY